eukprot:TRINITY_DN16555_c0_g1_i1.p1 TRINITY_DN16555_c0_g1~~TRINITY_DN16555_c0_g1_i1.p1  ORF type:complete len:111 (-),score=11.31 TRINITY_DN16555_c0_g1_i1:103-435(-)
MEDAKLRLDALCQTPAFMYGGCGFCFALMTIFMIVIFAGPLVHLYTEDINGVAAWAIAGGGIALFLLLVVGCTAGVFFLIKVTKSRFPNFGNDQDATFMLSDVDAEVDYI